MAKGRTIHLKGDAARGFMFAMYQEQIEDLKRQRSKLIDRIIPLDCPRGVVDCPEQKPGACDKCWLEWAEQPGEGDSFEGAI